MWENRSKRCLTQENSRQMSRENAVDSYTSEQNRDNNINTLKFIAAITSLDIQLITMGERGGGRSNNKYYVIGY